MDSPGAFNVAAAPDIYNRTNELGMLQGQISGRSILLQLEELVFENQGRHARSEKPFQDVWKAHPSPSTVDLYNLWYELLQDYALRKLTFDRDCLPAVAGFAKHFQGLLKDEYCAGLWKGDLLFGLLWTANHYDGILNLERRDTADTLSKDTLPSWSWVRVFSLGVKWPLRDEHPCRSATYLATLIDVEVYSLAGGDFGTVGGGRLTLNAPYRDFDLRLESLDEAVVPPWSLEKLAQIVMSRPDFPAATDTRRSVVISRRDAMQRFTFVQIVRYPRSLELLLLEPLAIDISEETGQIFYRRVARASLKPYKDEDDSSVKEEKTARLEDAAYHETINEEWPRGTFVII